MATARFLVGDVRDRVAEISDGTVDLVVTSPPFLALRSYLPADHPDKQREIGSEATPAEFLDVLLGLTAEWGRVLAPHGSLAVELGDTYAGAGGARRSSYAGGIREMQPRFAGSGSKPRIEATRPGTSSRLAAGSGWPLDKSLTGIPTLYAWSLAYGRNLLTGIESPAGQWRIRNLVAWVKPNPPVGELGDKYRPGTSYVTVATRERDRWFDLGAVRQPPSENTHQRIAEGSQPRYDLPSQQRDGNWHTLAATNDQHPAGVPPLDWWEIPPRGYKGAHHAVFPPELPRRLVASMCPRRVCTTCGQPSRRIVEPTKWPRRATAPLINDGGVGSHGERAAHPNTTGWSTCGCPGTDGIRLDGFHVGTGWRPGLVLDPFAGTGTTLQVAHGLGRSSIGIDLDAGCADQARDRLGMFLDIDQPDTEETA